MPKKVLLILLLLISIFSFKNVYAEEENEVQEEVEEQTDLIQNNINKYTNDTTNYALYFNDLADIIIEEDESKLIEEMKPLTEYGNIMFETIRENSYYSTAEYASNRYHQLFGTTSGTLLVIDMQNRYIYIFSDGENYNYITDSKADIITDNIYRYASNGDYYDCASEAFSEIYTVLGGGKILEPMRYISNILLSILIAFSFSFILVMAKTKIAKASNTEVLKGCDIAVDISNVVGTKTGTHRVYSPPADSGGSSGGGSSGGGGGGGSSGGGGGHGF